MWRCEAAPFLNSRGPECVAWGAQRVAVCVALMDGAGIHTAAASVCILQALVSLGMTKVMAKKLQRTAQFELRVCKDPDAQPHADASQSLFVHSLAQVIAGYHIPVSNAPSFFGTQLVGADSVCLAIHVLEHGRLMVSTDKHHFSLHTL